MVKNITLSIVVTTHNEGLLAHKTMRSVFAATEALREKYNYEIIIHIDKGDRDTIKYFNRYKNRRDVKIFRNNFGNLSASRNFCVNSALGHYITFLDGDDLVSANWFLEGIKTLKSTKKDSIVYPEAVLMFGLNGEHNLTIQKPSSPLDKCKILLLGENCWSSVVMAKSEIFKKYPYKIFSEGYGYEDYAFNVETLYANIPHKIAKKTTLFYRQKSHSMRTSYFYYSKTLPFSPLFDFKHIKSIDISQFIAKTEPGSITSKEKDTSVKEPKSLIYRAYKSIRNNQFFNFFITPLAKLTLKLLRLLNAQPDDSSPDTQTEKNLNPVPDFVIEQWAAINNIEAQLYPQQYYVDRLSFYSAESQLPVGITFARIAQFITKIPDIIFLVPWIVRGGADKVLLNYIKALKQAYPGKHIIVISTLPVKNPWSEKITENVDFIDFGNLSAELSDDMRETLFTRLIIQLQCKRLHIINSEFAYHWVMRHLPLIKKDFNLSVSLFCGEFIPDSNMKGWTSFADPLILNIYPAIKKIFTDNRAIINKTVLKNGFDISKFHVHYQPIDHKEIKIRSLKKHEGPLKILWASRIAKPKIPHIVVEIAKKLDPKQFTIDMFGEVCNGIDEESLQNIPTLNYRGVYNGLQSINTSGYDLYLYTAMDDGVPNAILEAAAAGLPIIASDDGGVKEFIQDQKTGILVQDPLDVNLYIHALKFAKENFAEIHKYVERSQDLLKTQHSWSKFLEKVKEDF